MLVETPSRVDAQRRVACQHCGSDDPAVVQGCMASHPPRISCRSLLGILGGGLSAAVSFLAVLPRERQCLADSISECSSKTVQIGTRSGKMLLSLLCVDRRKGLEHPGISCPALLSDALRYMCRRPALDSR